MRSLKINALLNIIRQSLSVLFPLITYPYALRVLGVEAMGKVNYGSSIISYFALFAMLGIVSYSVREGSKKKDNFKEFVDFSNEIFTINLIFTVVAYILLFFCLILIPRFRNYRLLLVIQSLSIILTTLGVDWINTIFEDFLFITIRSIFSQLISLIMLFLIVKSPNHYYIYAALTVLSNGITCISNWIYCRKYVKVRITFHPKFRKHIKPLLILFSNSMMIVIYVTFDTVMLGWIKGDYAVGLYSAAVKIYSVMKNIIAAAYSVAIPRLAYYYGNGIFDKFKNLYSALWSYVLLFLLPVAALIVCISDEIMLIMGGKEYLGASVALKILAFALIFAIFGGLVATVLNLTIGREGENLIATAGGAMLNLALNVYFIPRYSLYGAAFTTMLSEGFVFAFCFIRIKNKEEFMYCNLIIKELLHSIIGVLVMCVYCVVIHCFIEGLLIKFGLMLVGSCFLYLAVLSIFKDKYIIKVITAIKTNCSK